MAISYRFHTKNLLFAEKFVFFLRPMDNLMVLLSSYEVESPGVLHTSWCLIIRNKAMECMKHNAVLIRWVLLKS